MLAAAALAVFLTIALITDLHKMIIPNALTVPAALLGVVLNAFTAGWDGVGSSLTGLLVGFVCLVALYLAGALGAGDVKLFAAIGALAGTEFTLFCLMYSVLCAGVAGIVVWLWQKKLSQRIRGIYVVLLGLLALKDVSGWRTYTTGERVRFPFMLAVIPGALCAAFDMSKLLTDGW